MEMIRKAAVAGMFYPASTESLKKQIEFFLNNSETELPPKNISGIIAPHAGYIYSGATAAAAYALLKNSGYSDVVVISPSHHEFFGGCSIFPGDFYETPLGKIEIDKELSEKIVSKSRNVFFGAEGHRDEHALEVQLPFLQTTVGGFKLVPIIMGDQKREIVIDLADALADAINDDTLIVASSDLSHYHEKAAANKLDSKVAERINAFDFEGLLDDLEIRVCEACGGGPITALMSALKKRGKENVRVVRRSDSGDVSGDDKQVVGYLSAVVY